MKSVKTDDCFANSLFEETKSEKNSNAYYKQLVKQNSPVSRFVGNYDKLKFEIDNMILEIKEEVLSCNPIQLLQCSSNMFQMQGLKLTSQNEKDGLAPILSEYNKPYMATELIQSIYASSPENKNLSVDEDNSDLFFKIISDIEKVMDRINVFYFCVESKVKEKYPELDEDSIKLLMEEQFYYNVRGKRFQIFEREYIEKLLLPHNIVFVETFGLTSRDVIDGFIKIEYALSQQKCNVFTQFNELYERFQSKGEDIENSHFNNEAELNDIIDKLFGTKLHDVSFLTNWPEEFINELSWEQNGCPDFWEGEYGGWPVIDMPVSKRPFIKIDGKAYCFDYYSFVDNFYRSVQKAITRVKKDYQWSSIQQDTSERMVADVFESILPGCKTYVSNYYPMNQSLKKMAENDIIVTYDNTLIIVEVKAGSFVYTSPLTDFESHIKSYKKLIEEADVQCHRTKEYLEKNKISKIYNHDKSEKCEINMSDYSSIYMMSITVDNINEFAAKAEKLKFLKLKSNAISIAIDDLMVYREYFDSPLIFLHFLKQRHLATQNPLMALNDELDHLGMYISHNCYNYQTKGVKKDSEIMFVGYRDDLCNYYNALYHPQLNPQKPIQRLPNLFVQIIEYLTTNQIEGRCSIANYLLDFSSDAKDEMCCQVQYVLKRQKEIHNTIPYFTSGDKDSLRYSLFINQKPYEWNYRDQLDYTLATLSWNKENDRVMITLIFNNDEFKKIDFKYVSPSDITDENRERITKLGEYNAKRRMSEYKKHNPGKIGRNSRCPCGSGKKYKKCCGR